MHAPLPESRSYAIALAGGAFLWLAIAWSSGQAEAWDSPLYWKLGYPLSLLLAGGLGFACPVRPWRWGLAVLLVQPVMMALTSGSGFGLLPLGLVLFGVLALPAVAAAGFGARLRARQGF